MWVSSLLCGMPVGSFFFAFEQSNTFGRLITYLLFLGSIAAWTLMFNKGRQLREAQRSADAFIKAYHKASDPLVLFRDASSFVDAPLSRLYQSACASLGAVLETDRDALTRFDRGHPFRISERHLRVVRSAVDRAVAEEALSLEANMGMLATAASTAPFLGLLGTVWGVMDAFGEMSSGGTALLSDVAPGISAALLTTVVALIVAIPSAFGYNLLSGDIRKLVVQMDNFAQELVSDLEQYGPGE